MTNSTKRPSPLPTYALQTYEMTADDFNKIRNLIYKQAGIVITESKKEMVYGRLTRRLRELGLTRFDQYLNLLNKDFGPVSIIRPTQTKGAAMGAVQALTADGLFIGQSKAFFDYLTTLATEADAAQREGRDD